MQRMDQVHDVADLICLALIGQLGSRDPHALVGGGQQHA